MKRDSAQRGGSIRRHICRLLVCAMFAAVLLPMAQADAHTKRGRSGIQEWAPDWINFKNTRINSSTQELRWRFKWLDDTAMEELDRGSSHRGFELKAAVHASWADDYSGSSNVQDNIPNVASVYRDSILTQSGSGTGFGVGVTYPEHLNSNFNYYAYVNLDTGAQSSSPQGFHVYFAVYSDLFHPGGFMLCTGILCNFHDYYLTHFNAIDYSVANSASKSAHQYLHNWDDYQFENSGAGWSFNSGSYTSVVSSSNSIDGSYILKLWGPGTGTTAWADASSYGADATDHFTVSAMFRCPAAIGKVNCSGEIGYKPTGGQIENDANVIIPDDNQWYVCRVDFDHGGSAAWPSSGGSTVRVFARNFRSGQVMYVDDVRLGPFTNNVTMTSGDPGPLPPVGSTCTKASSLNS